ncbi:MAG: hypothetical protein NVSMB52_18430 [Chloroflexota bacterium]
MSASRDDIRQELLAMMSARRELTPTDDAYLVEVFLDRLDSEIDERIDMRLQGNHAQKRGANRTAIVAVSLGVAIPLTALAIPFGIMGLGLIWFAILLVVILTTRD